MPFSTSPFVIFYNKDLFDKAGLEDPNALAAKGEWNMAKFQEVAKKLKDTTGKWGFEFKDGQGYDTRIMHALMPPIRAAGGDVWAASSAASTSLRRWRPSSSCTTWSSRTSRSCRPANRGTISPAAPR